MRIPSGKTDQRISFVALAAAGGSRMTGLTSGDFTIERSRNGGTKATYTTPTIIEDSASDMPGDYWLLIDEDTTIASTSDSEEYKVVIKAAGMETITRTIELYRRDTTSGQTLTVSSGNGNAAVQSIAGGAITSSTFANNSITSAVMSNASRDAISVNVWSYGGNRTLTAIDEDNTTLDLDATIRGAIGMAAADLDTQIDTLATAAALATVDTVVDAIQAKTDNLPADPAATSDITALNDLSAADVNAEVVDALNTDTYAEPGQGAPGATISLAQKIGYLYKAFRNRKTQTSTTFSLYADDATTVDQKSTVSDDGTTAERGEIVTGP